MEAKTDKKQRIEEEILGACIYYPEFIDIAQRTLITNNFSKVNGEIFKILMDINKGENVSSDLIIDFFRETSYDIRDFISTGSQAVQNEFIFENKIKRLLDLNFSIIAENKLKSNLEKIKTSEQGLDSLIELRNDIDSLLETKDKFRKEKNLAETLPSIFSEIENERNGVSDSLTSLHFPSFNYCTKGLSPGNLCTISGAWKNGKTTFGLNLLLDFSFHNSVPVGIFSLEMSEREIQRKILAMYTGQKYENLRNPKSLTDVEFNRMKEDAIKKFYNSKIYLNYKILNSESEIKAIAKNWIKKYGVKIILIDYIGLIKTSQKGKGENRERELSFISQFLKHTAMELNIPIISIAQLNRAGLVNPSTENLAESIGIARDSDFIFTIYKPLAKNNGMKIKINGRDIALKENYFVVKLCDSRHTQSGKQFILEMKENGSLVELATEYNN